MSQRHILSPADERMLAPRDQVSAAVQAVFDKSRDELGRRVRTLEDAVTAMLAGQLDEGLRASARRDAHKLVGSLGMFGLSRGSELARELEHALIDDPPLSEAARLAELVLALHGELECAPSGGREAGLAKPPQSAGRALRRGDSGPQ